MSESSVTLPVQRVRYRRRTGRSVTHVVRDATHRSYREGHEGRWTRFAWGSAALCGAMTRAVVNTARDLGADEWPAVHEPIPLDWITCARCRKSYEHRLSTGRIKREVEASA